MTIRRCVAYRNDLHGTLTQLFDLEVKGQGPMKVITVRDTPPYGHAPTYQISLTYLERQKWYGPDKKTLFKKQLFDLEVKGQGPTKVIMVRDLNINEIVHLIVYCFSLFLCRPNNLSLVCLYLSLYISFLLFGHFIVNHFYAKLVRTITFLSFVIGQWYFVWGTICKVTT
jgi:hypothetical protein